VLRTIAIIGVIQIASVVFGLLRTKILALLLGPSGVGALSVVDQVVQVVAYVSSFSLPYAAVKFLSRSHSRSGDEFRLLYGSLLRLLFGLAIIGTAIGLFVTIAFPGVLGNGLEAYRAYLIPAFLAIPAMTLNGFFGGTLAAAQRSNASASIALVGAVSLAISAYLGISIGGIVGLYWCNVGALILIAVGLSYYLRRELSLPLLTEGGGIRKALRDNPDVIPYSAILYVTSFALSASSLVARYTVISHFGEAEAGLLQASISLSAALGLVMAPTNALYLTPILNRDIGKAAKEHAAIQFLAKLALIVCVPAMFIVLFPQLLLRLLYSTAFVPVGGILYIFVVSQVLLLLAGVFQALLIGFDDLKAYGVISLLGYLVVAGGSLLAGPRYGIVGVAVALLTANAAIFIFGLARLRSTHELLVPGRLYATLLYAVSALAVGGVMASRLDSPSLTVIGSKLGLYCAFVASLVLMTSRQEFMQVISIGRARLIAAGGRRVSAKTKTSVGIDA